MLIEAVDRRLPGVTGGATVTLLALSAAVAPGLLLEHGIHSTSPIPYLVLSVILLRFTFSLASLERVASRAASVEPGRRREVTDRLVTRDLDEVGDGHVNSALLETLSENTTDSFFTPLMYYALLGLPGALAYRALDVLDSTIGYRDREWKGAIPARLEDLASLLPSYLVLLPLAAAAETLGRGTGIAGLHSSRRFGGRRPGFNGKVMAFYAGALGVTLEKPGHYSMGKGPLPEEEDLENGVSLLRRTALLTSGILLTSLTLVEVVT